MFQRLAGNRRVNTSFPCDGSISSVVYDSCLDEVHFICFVLWRCDCSFFRNIFCLFSACVRKGSIRDEAHLKLSNYLWGSRLIMRSTHTRYMKSESQSRDISRMTQSCTVIYEINPELKSWLRTWLNRELRRSNCDWRMTTGHGMSKIVWRDWHVLLNHTRNHIHSQNEIMQHKKSHWKHLSWKGIDQRCSVNIIMDEFTFTQ